MVALCADVGMALFALGLICARNPLVGAAVATTMPLSWVSGS